MNIHRASFLVVGLFAAAFSSAPRLWIKAQSAAPQDESKPKPAPAKEDKPKESDAKKHRGKFTISKETTYVTGPLDKDGYIDYAAALNERLSKGVTPENNANVLIWKAIGPRPEGPLMPTKLFQLMSMEALPEKGQCFIDLKHYLKK